MGTTELPLEVAGVSELALDVAGVSELALEVVGTSGTDETTLPGVVWGVSVTGQTVVESAIVSVVM